MKNFFNKATFTSPLAVAVYACLGTVGIGLGVQAYRNHQAQAPKTEAPKDGMPPATNQQPTQAAAS